MVNRLAKRYSKAQALLRMRTLSLVGVRVYGVGDLGQLYCQSAISAGDPSDAAV